MNPHLIPDRAWIATLHQDGRAPITITVYGPNAGEAERRAERDRGAGARVIIRAELPTR